MKAPQTFPRSAFGLRQDIAVLIDAGCASAGESQTPLRQKPNMAAANITIILDDIKYSSSYLSFEGFIGAGSRRRVGAPAEMYQTASRARFDKLCYNFLAPQLVKLQQDGDIIRRTGNKSSDMAESKTHILIEGCSGALGLPKFSPSQLFKRCIGPSFRVIWIILQHLFQLHTRRMRMVQPLEIIAKATYLKNHLVQLIEIWRVMNVANNIVAYSWPAIPR